MTTEGESKHGCRVTILMGWGANEACVGYFPTSPKFEELKALVEEHFCPAYDLSTLVFYFNESANTRRYLIKSDRDLYALIKDNKLRAKTWKIYCEMMPTAKPSFLRRLFRAKPH